MKAETFELASKRTRSSKDLKCIGAQYGSSKNQKLLRQNTQDTSKTGFLVQT